MNLPEQVMKAVMNWRPAHIFENVIPQLNKRGVTEKHIENIMVNNIRHIFGK
jgi:phosphotriesterase-related protein